MRIVHYLNQFFVRLGAEAHAGTGPGKKAGVVGPGIALQQALGECAQVEATVYCGDNYANERADAIDAILELVSEERPDILIAGPAFASGRYGLMCGALCVRAQDALGIVAVTGMHPDNPGTDLYRSKVHIARSRESAAGMGEAVKAMVRLALKLYDREPLGTPQEEGYIPTGRRVHFVAQQTAAQRAMDMLKLDRPSLDFVTLAKGMGVPGRAVATADELNTALAEAIREPGPRLIEVQM